jgi:adhesin HecA-like repeat protein
VNDTTTNATRYLTFTSATSGTIATANVSSTKLTFNPSLGTLTVTQGSMNSLSLTANIASSSTTTGTLTSAGGVGIVGSVNIGGSLGIGIHPPGVKLDVLGRMRIGSDATGADSGTGTVIWNTAGGDNGVAAFRHIFYTGANNTRTQRMTITSTGEVGIGTSSPLRLFEVYGSHTTATARIYSLGDGASSDASLDMWASEPGVSYPGAGLGNNVNGHPFYGKRRSTLGQSYIRFDGSGSFQVYTGSEVAETASLKMAVLAGGNVGIGTDNPGYRLHVAASSGTVISAVTNSGTTGSDQSILYTSAGSTSAQITSYGNGVTYFTSSSPNGMYVLNSANGPMLFYTNNTERMRIPAGGNLLLGTSVDSVTGLTLGQDRILGWAESTNTSYPNIFRQASSAALALGWGVRFSSTANAFASSIGASVGKSAITVGNLAIRFYVNDESTVSAGTNVTMTERMNINNAGTLSVTGDVVANTASDARLKTNVRKIENALDRLVKLSGVIFDWNSRAREIYPERTQQDVGVIAQEVQEVLPEIVTERDNGYLAVKYEKLIPLLIEAIKELNKKIDK